MQMILTYWHGKDWTKEEIDVYARMIQDLDAEIATSTLIRASKEVAYRPPISEFRDMYRAEKRRLAPVVPPKEGAPQEIPFWVKRWICARLLYERFGKERDMRRFLEAGDYGDLSQEMMPEGAWVEEVNTLPEGEFSRAFKSMFKT